MARESSEASRFFCNINDSLEDIHHPLEAKRKKWAIGRLEFNLKSLNSWREGA